MKFIVTVTESYRKEMHADTIGDVLNNVQSEYVGSDKKLINFFIQPQNDDVQIRNAGNLDKV